MHTLVLLQTIEFFGVNSSNSARFMTLKQKISKTMAFFAAKIFNIIPPSAKTLKNDRK